MSDSLTQLAIQAAEQFGVPPQLFLDQINAESGFNPNVPPSATGALGLGQILPSTAANPGLGMAGIDPSGLSDPATNLAFAAQYDAQLYAQTGSWAGAMTAYNVGLGNYQSGALQPSAAYQGLAAEGATYDAGGGNVSGSAFSNETIGAGLAGTIPGGSVPAYDGGAGEAVAGGASNGGTNGTANGSGWGFPTIGGIESAVTGALPRFGFIAVGMILLLTAGFLFVFSGKEGGTPIPIPV